GCFCSLPPSRADKALRGELLAPSRLGVSLPLWLIQRQAHAKAARRRGAPSLREAAVSQVGLIRASLSGLRITRSSAILPSITSTENTLFSASFSNSSRPASPLTSANSTR